METIISTEKNKYIIKPQIEVEDVDYKKEDLRDDQYEVAKKVLRYNCGLVQCPTGWGKSYLMVYLCKYLPKPLLMTSPSSAINQEFGMRLNYKNILYSTDIESNSDIIIINSNGLARTKKFLNGEYDEKFSTFKTILTDECACITNSLELVLQKLTNCERFFGFSATADKVRGSDLTNPKNYKLSDVTAKILSYYGKALVYIGFTKHINLIKSDIPLYYDTYDGEYEPWRAMLGEKKIMNSKKILQYFKSAIFVSRNYTSKKNTILVPYLSQKNVRNLIFNPVFKDDKVAIWNSQGLFINDGSYYLGKDGYPKLKELIDNHELDLVFSSSISRIGVDFPELRNIMLFSYSSFGVVTQILGRASRGDETVNIFLPNNTLTCPMYSRQYNKRLRWINLLDGDLQVSTLKI